MEKSDSTANFALKWHVLISYIIKFDGFMDIQNLTILPNVDSIRVLYYVNFENLTKIKVEIPLKSQ